MTTSTVTSKGQTTIPKKVRDYLGLKSHQKIAFEVKDGYVIMRKMEDSLDRFAGILGSDRPAASKQEERRAAGRKLGRRGEAER